MVNKIAAQQAQVSIADITAQSWILDLKTIKGWVNELSGETDNLAVGLAVGFCSLKRWLTEHVEDAPVRSESLELMNGFVDKLKTLLESNSFEDTQIPLLFGILMTIIGEVGPYRYETRKDPNKEIWNDILAPMEALRAKTVEVSKAFFSQAVFQPIQESIRKEIFPLLDVAVETYGDEHDQYMPFRVIQIGKIAERLLELAEWLEDRSPDGHHELIDLLHRCYDLKYPRFGTSGLRGVWQKDFTEPKARRTAQVVCQYLAGIDIPGYVVPKAQDLSGKWIVVGYDGRRNSLKVATWLAEVALANGFPVQISSRPTPTPAIAFYATEVAGKDHLAGILNCTASHNPPEWQGIKFNPKEGYPAPTHLTDIIAARLNELQLLDVQVPGENVQEAEAAGKVRYYDPIMKYKEWLWNNASGNQRLPLNFDNIRAYFKDKLVVIDEFHGAGNGYMEIILGRLGIPFDVMHHERDENFTGLDYANPELPYIKPLMKRVEDLGADLGLGLDTDADRFGVVGEGGVFFRPNQILAMLSYYLGHDRKEGGRLVVTQTGLPVIEAIAQHFPNIERPAKGVLPPYIDHVFYKRRIGSPEDVEFKNVFVVPVGIKYIVEIPRMDTSYKLLDEDKLGGNWMNRILLGGEESSGLTTRGHIPDKDGTWANMLIMDMIAHYKMPLQQIWEMVTASQDAWMSYGGRVDVDASDRAKEKLISYYLDAYKGKKPGEVTIEGYPILYAGGTRYDMVEIFLGDHEGRRRNFLRLRASGTEPINRIYCETSDPDLWQKLFHVVLDKLDEFTIQEIQQSYRLERMVDLLATTSPGTWETVLRAVRQKLEQEGWDRGELVSAMKQKMPHLENRNREIVLKWLKLI